MEHLGQLQLPTVVDVLILVVIVKLCCACTGCILLIVSWTQVSLSLIIPGPHLSGLSMNNECQSICVTIQGLWVVHHHHGGRGGESGTGAGRDPRRGRGIVPRLGNGAGTVIGAGRGAAVEISQGDPGELSVLYSTPCTDMHDFIQSILLCPQSPRPSY